jgi:hypothetical protein
MLLGSLLLCQKSVDLILSWELVGRVVFPANRVGKRTLLIFISTSLLGILGSGSPFLISGIHLFVPIFVSSWLLRIF